MLGPRDALIAQLVKSLGLVNDAGLKRATELKKRFPNQGFEQILVSMGLLDKAGYTRLLAAYQAQQAKAPPSKPAAPARATPAAKPRAEPGSDDGLIVPDEEDQRALARRPARGVPTPDPLATPPSDENLSTDTPPPDEDAILAEPTLQLRDDPAQKPTDTDEDAILAEPTLMIREDEKPKFKGAPPKGKPAPAPKNEDAILAEPTLMLRDDELKSPPKPAAKPADKKRPPPRPEPTLKPTSEDLILAEPTLMMPDEELRAAPPPKARKGELELELKPTSEDEILAEPTLMVPTDEEDAARPAKTNEEAILAEPTLMLGDDELKSGGRPGGDFPNLDLMPSDEAGTGGFFAGNAPAAPAPAEAPLELPANLVAGEAPAPQGPKGPQPGAKKKAKGGVLDRKEFERRSKLRMSYEGLHIGDYEIVGELARGAFGVVLRVKPESTAKTLARERGFQGEFMAMKVMLETNDPEETRRFMDEVKVLIELVHPNIIRIFDAGVEKGLKYYTMELIEGVDTRTLVREQGGKLPVLYAVRIAKDVAAALAVVHQKTIYHRDLKPANVMIDRKSQPYRTVLIDFGLVTKKQTGEKKDDGLILGTPSYMPPEQAKPKGGFGEVNGTSDIYSLGATFYFLMTGTSPFPGKDPREIIKRVCTEPPPSPTTLNPEIPKSIAALCMKCLAKNQRERYVAARLLEQELEKELNAAQLKLKAKGFVRKLFGGGSGTPPKA